jgi:hypothetical protein
VITWVQSTVPQKEGREGREEERMERKEKEGGRRREGRDGGRHVELEEYQRILSHDPAS